DVGQSDGCVEHERVSSVNRIVDVEVGRDVGRGVQQGHAGFSWSAVGLVGVALPAGPDSVGPFGSPTTRTRHDVIHRALVPAAESAGGADSAVTDAQGVTG